MNFNVIQQLAGLCAAKGIEHVILCPGSRSAPLALAFLRSSQFTCWTFSDERSAAFIGTAMAQQTQRPVILICTSGSAGYNFAPAVAEAYFQRIPLIVLTADRPKEWIDQLDGQTIRQPNLYGKHVKRFYELPQEYGHEDALWHANRIVNEAINLAEGEPRGPVHINAPFREPLYPNAIESNPVQKTPRHIRVTPRENILNEAQWAELIKSLNQFQRPLLVSGQQQGHPSLPSVLSAFHAEQRWPTVGDILCNLHGLPFLNRHSDAFLGQMPEKQKSSLQPDLLITFGKSLVSKNLKLFLRKFSPREHWHIQPEGDVADTFKSLTRVINTSPEYFFAELTNRTKTQADQAYSEEWTRNETRTRREVETFFETQQQGEFAFLNKVMRALPDHCNLHLANSMSVRYANHIALTDKQAGIKVFGNRGTSGIDGCTSTAVGHALTSAVPNVLITGDQAFFYDRNAFWHNYPLPNLFVVVLNNHGGIIFNMIDGPAGMPEAEEFFITRQVLRARPLAEEFGLSYNEGASASLKEFFKADGNAKIIELESTQSLNKQVFESFRKQIMKIYET